MSERKLIETGPFATCALNGYRVILCDPPWKYVTWSKKGMGKSPDNHYDTMTLDDLKALPVRDLAAKDCVLFMWVIDTHVEMALELIKAWGFTYKTVGFYWAKTNKDGSMFMNTGHWTRANPEHVFESYFGEEQDVERVFLNTVGRPGRRKEATAVRRLVVAPRMKHSEKPNDIADSISELVDGPRIELFARRFYKDWTVWGNEISPTDAPEVMEIL